MVGASGAIMGLAGMFFVLYPFNELAIHSPDTYIWSGDAWRMPSWVFVLLYMILDLFGTLQKGGGIAYAAHLAGEITGVALAIGLVQLGWVTSDRGEQNLPEAWGWVKEKPAPRRKRRKPKPPPPRVEI
jgi:membrane associated rhomboid family serine protease